MKFEDIPKVFEIADAIWGPDYHESVDVYIDKFMFCPGGCWVFDVQGVVGYFVSHPAKLNVPPNLNSLLDKTCITDSWHIHDIVLDEEFRGNGYAADLIKRILNDHPIVTLVAADRSLKTQKNWECWNFKISNVVCDYGTYMIKQREL